MLGTVDGSTIPPPSGTLYVSDAQGTDFTLAVENTNRDLSRNLVDFERIGSAFYDGVMLVNRVENIKEIEKDSRTTKEITSLMSFNQGSAWDVIIPPKADSQGNEYCKSKGPSECSLHFHSVTSMKNVGKLFTASSAPGIMVGVGSVGSFLVEYEASDTFISKDFGKSWNHVQTGPYKYEIINVGCTIVLVPDGKDPASSIKYSKNMGRSWETFDWKLDDSSWVPLFTMLDQTSETSHLILAVAKGRHTGPRYILSVDFSSLYARTCEFNASDPKPTSDIELFEPSAMDTCLMGQKMGYFRRKQDAECSIAPSGHIALHSPPEPCACSRKDFECDLNYYHSVETGECVQQAGTTDQLPGCTPGTTYQGLSGYRKIPGNRCEGGDDKLDAPVTKTCAFLPHSRLPVDRLPTSKLTSFSQRISKVHFVNSTNIVLALTHNGELWRSTDGGSQWGQVKLSQPVLQLLYHPKIFTRLFVATSDKIYLTENAAGDLKELTLPGKPNSFGIPTIDFHNGHPDWYIYVSGGSDCQTTTCFSKVFVSRDAGATFTEIETWATKCMWASNAKFQNVDSSDDSVLCSSYQVKDGKVGQDKLNHSHDNPQQLVMITDSGKKHTVVLSQDVQDFYFANNMAIAAYLDGTEMVLQTSKNGLLWKMAKFPPAIKLSSKGFTVLASHSGGILLDVIQNSDFGNEVGFLYKSNEDGEFFSKILRYTNRGSNGKADLEHMPGIPGILVTNFVDNGNLISNTIPKSIRSLISIDDGSTWDSLIAPELDAAGDSINCIAKDGCHLHLHSYADGFPLQTVASTTPGVLIAVGNTGKQLTSYQEAQTYMTSNSGKLWKQIAFGPRKSVVANYGGLIVTADDKAPTKAVQFSWNFGQDWETFEFSETPIRISSLRTSGMATLSVLVLGVDVSKGNLDNQLYSIDFTSLFPTVCTSSDFGSWEVARTSGDQCFLGENRKLFQRKATSLCSIPDNWVVSTVDSTVCKCEESDYECEFNFFRNEIGDCQLYGDDLSSGQCKLGELYTGISGYRKIGLSQCKDGLDLTAPVERICGQGSPGPVSSISFLFPSFIQDFFSLKSSSSILGLTDAGKVFASLDDGKTWRPIQDSIDFSKIILDPNFSNRAFLISEDKGIFMTVDSANTFSLISPPVATDTNLVQEPLSLHYLNSEYLIWNGVVCSGGNSDCHLEAHVSWNKGKEWQSTKQEGICQWGSSKNFRPVSSTQIFCMTSKARHDANALSARKSLISLDPKNSLTEPNALFDTTGYTIQDAFMIVAVVLIF